MTHVEFTYVKKQNRAKSHPIEHRGCGEVKFMTYEEAKRASEFKKHSFNGVEFQVRFFVPEHIRKEREKMAINEKRKIIVLGVPKGYPKGKVQFLLLYF